MGHLPADSPQKRGSQRGSAHTAAAKTYHDLPGLTDAERQLYLHLLATNARLEQEQLPARYVAATTGLAGVGGTLPRQS